MKDKEKERHKEWKIEREKVWKIERQSKVAKNKIKKKNNWGSGE